MRLQPLMLHVEFNNDLEYAKRELGEVIRSIQRWARPCMHQRRSVCLVIITRESAVELVKRLRPTLDANTTDYRCHVAPYAVIGRHGSIDTMVTQVAAAWKEIGERRNSQHVRKPQFTGSERRIDHRQGGAVGQMFVEAPGTRKPSKDFDGE